MTYLCLCGFALVGLAVVPRLMLRYARRGLHDALDATTARAERNRLLALLDDERRARDRERCPVCHRPGSEVCPCASQ